MATEVDHLLPEIRAANAYRLIADTARAYGDACRYEGRSALHYMSAHGQPETEEARKRWDDAQTDVIRAWNAFLEALRHVLDEPWREPARRRP